MANNKRLQERKTREDTKNAQSELREIIRHKYLDNPFLSYEEQQKWLELVDDSVLSKGKWIEFVYDVPDPENYNYIRKISFGNIKNALKNMMIKEFAINRKNEFFYINYLGERVKINLRHFWRELYKQVEEVFSLALDEATHMSAESPKRPKRSSYEWEAQKS